MGLYWGTLPLEMRLPILENQRCYTLHTSLTSDMEAVQEMLFKGIHRDPICMIQLPQSRSIAMLSWQVQLPSWPSEN